MSGEQPRFGWGHININVSNLERSIEFYQKLGFELFLPGIPYLGISSEPDPHPVPEPACEALGLPPGTTGRACILQLGRGFPKVDLIELAGTEPANPIANGDLGLVRLCLATADLRAEHARLTDLGVAFLSAPQPGRDGLADIATCVDPDGALIELLQVYLEKWPTNL